MDNADAVAIDPPPETAGARTPFELWLDPARPKAQLWRLLLGIVLVVVVWLLWTALVIAAFAVFNVLTGQVAVDDVLGLIDDVVASSNAVHAMVLLSTFAGLWIGVWLAMRLLDGGQKLATLFSPERRIRWREFGVGMAIVSGYLALSTLLSVLTGNGPRWVGTDTGAWLMAAAPLAALIFIQSSGEEVFFRGYLVQHLAPRFRHPLIWGLLPAFLFGMGHYAPDYELSYGLYYVAATTLIGLTATALIWRTGGLSAAMGLHVANNLVAFLIAGPDDTASGTQLWVWSTSDMQESSGFDLLTLVLLLGYVLSPWAPLAGRPLWGRRNETRAAP